MDEGTWLPAGVIGVVSLPGSPKAAFSSSAVPFGNDQTQRNTGQESEISAKHEAE